MPARHKIIPVVEQIRFGEYLRKVRLEAGFSQEVLAKELGVSQSYVSKVERGERQMQVLEFLKVCKAMGLDASTILSGYK